MNSAGTFPAEIATRHTMPSRVSGPVLFGAVLALAAIAALLLLIEPALLAVAVGLIALGVTVVRPQVAVYLMMAIVGFFEVTTPDRLMQPWSVLQTGESSLGLVVNPLEVLLSIALFSWLAQALMRRRLDLRGGALLLPMLAFAFFLVAGLVRGLVASGDGRIAFWESRFIAYMVVCYWLTTNTIRTTRQVQRLGWIFLAATSAFAVEGTIRRFAWDALVGSSVSRDGGYDHTDPIFLGTALLMVLALLTFGATRPQRWLASLLIPLLTFTLFATERRAGLVALMVTLALFACLLIVVRRRAFAAIFVPLLVISVVYFPLFWNNTSILGQPARAVQSLIDPNVRDAASNDYRELEKVDVNATIQADPLMGVGFGRPFLFVVPLPDLSFWEFWQYEPHANVLWIWLKTGMFGFIAFLTLMGVAIQRATRLAATAVDGQSRAIAVFVLAAIVMTLVVSSVDVALVAGGRAPALVGIAMGVISTLERARPRP